MLGQCQHVNNDVLPTTPTQRYPTLAQRLLAIWDNANVGHRMTAIWEILVGLVFFYPRGAGIWLGFSIGPTPANNPARTLLQTTKTLQNYRCSSPLLSQHTVRDDVVHDILMRVLAHVHCQ